MEGVDRAPVRVRGVGGPSPGSGRPVRAIHRALLEARAWGLAHLDLLAESAAVATGVPVTDCRTYFAGLDYAFSDTHLAGLSDFFRRLVARGIVPDGSLRFLQVA